MEALYFIAVSIVLYWLADRLLILIENARGEPFEQRTIVFFLILLTLAIATFALIRRVL